MCEVVTGVTGDGQCPADSAVCQIVTSTTNPPFFNGVGIISTMQFLDYRMLMGGGGGGVQGTRKMSDF